MKTRSRVTEDRVKTTKRKNNNMVNLYCISVRGSASNKLYEEMEDCYKYISDNKLHEDLPEIISIYTPKHIQCTCGLKMYPKQYKSNMVLYMCTSGHEELLNKC